MSVRGSLLVVCLVALACGAGAPVAGAVEWSAPVQASDPEVGTAEKPELKFDPAGNAFLMYRNSSFASMVIAPPGKPFGKATRPPSDIIGAPKRITLDFDAKGNAMVVWLGGNEKLKAARRSPGPDGTLGPIQELTPAAQLLYFNVDVNPSGEALISWVSGLGQIYAAYSPAGAATAAPSFTTENVGNYGSASWVYPVLDPSTGSAPSAALIWGAEGDAWTATASNVGAADPFGAPAGLDPGSKAGGVFAASNDAGQAVAIWRYEVGLDPLSPEISARSPGGAFGGPAELSTDPVGAMSAAMGAGGTGAFAWLEQEPPKGPEEPCGLGNVSVFHASTPFSTAVQSSPEDFNAQDPAVAVSPSGSVLSAWWISDCTSGSTGYDGIQVQFDSTAPHSLVLAQNSTFREPKVAFDAYGNAIAVYVDGGASKKLMAARYVVQEPPAEEPPKEEPPKGEPPKGDPPAAGGGGGGGPTPGNVASIAKAKGNEGDGSVTLTVNVPGPGTVKVTATASVPGSLLSKATRITVAGKTAQTSAAGPVSLKLKPSAKAKKVLKKKGKLSAKALVEFTPAGGTKGTTTSSVTFKLKKKQ